MVKARRKSRPVRVGKVVVGGAAEIVVQSMCKSDTRDVKATLEEIARLKDASCRIVRVAVPTKEAAQAMVQAALGHVRILEALDFQDIKVSMKASDPPTMIAANRAIADKIPYPLHLGVTESGPPRTGAVKSAVGIGVLLEEGIGDTIRVSLAGDSVEEVEVAYGIIKALSEKQTGPNLIASPMCVRLEIAILPQVAEVEKALKKIKRPINVSVMGCVVNGPGEGQHADIGIAGGKNKGILFKHGKIVGTFPEKELVPALLRELDAIAKEDEQKLAS